MFTFCIPVEAHRAKDLGKTLMSLTLQEDKDFKVAITCDTAPDDEVRKIIKKYSKDLSISYKLVLQKNFQRQNRNESVKLADTDYIWLLDCDIPVLTKDASRTVNRLLQPHNVYTVSLFDCRLSPTRFNQMAEGKSAHEVVNILTDNLKDSDFDGLGLFYDLTKKPFQTNHVADNMPIMTKELYQIVGGIHPHYHGWGGEKHEFCLKLKRLARDRAINIFHIPSIRTVHIPHVSIHRSNNKLKAQNRRRFNHIQFGLEHGYLYIQKEIDEMKTKISPLPVPEHLKTKTLYDQLYNYYKYGIDHFVVDNKKIYVDPVNPLKPLAKYCDSSKPFIYTTASSGHKHKPKIVIGITTRNRPEMLESTIASLLASLEKQYNYHFILADDNSSCRDKNMEIFEKIPYSKEYTYAQTRIGIHANNNAILKRALRQSFDFGFCLDDDLIFKPGWISLYYNAYLDTGYSHFCNFDPQTSISISYTISPFIVKVKNTEIISHAKNIVQGALFTFNRKMLDTIGGMDADNYGLTSIGHVDYTIRARRAGFMPDYGFEHFFDVYGGAKFVCLNLENYKPANDRAGKDKSQAFFNKTHRDPRRIKVDL